MPAYDVRNQPSLHILSSALSDQLLEFRIDRQARNLTAKTLRWYEQSLDLLVAYLESQGISTLADVSAGILRRFLLHLRERGHNDGGVKNIYGAVKALLRWYADELAPDGWRNPIAQVPTPRCADEPLDPVNLDHLRAMLATCERRTFAGDRDRALLMFLLDSGVRHAELCALNVGDVNLPGGTVMVREGKGRKPRMTFVGPKTRRALLTYLRHRPGAPDDAPLWVTHKGGRLSYGGIREVVRRRAKRADVPEPSLHSFRRAFAISALRGGMDLVSLQRLLGHSSLAVVSRYLRQVEGDLQAAHEKAGVVDRLL